MSRRLFNESVSTIRGILCPRWSNFFHVYFMEKTKLFIPTLPIILSPLIFLFFFSISTHLSFHSCHRYCLVCTLKHVSYPINESSQNHFLILKYISLEATGQQLPYFQLYRLFQEESSIFREKVP